jgi:hypothetical protein
LEKAIKEIHDEPGRPDLPMEIAFPAWAGFVRAWRDNELPGDDAEDAGLPEPEVP